MTQPVPYSAIVVTFRRPASLGRVLQSLLDQTSAPAAVVVADNDPACSAQAVVEDERWRALNVEYLALGTNRGPAGGWAAAAQAAARRDDRGSWLLVVDDDDPLGHPELAERLLRCAGTVPRPERCAAVGLRGAVLDRRRMRLHRVDAPEGTWARADYLAGNGAPLYRWDAIDEVGFFDGDLFFGFEDLDEGLRLTAAGWELWTMPLPSLHVVADTASTRVAWREYFKARALVVIARRRVGGAAVLSTIVRSVLLGGLLVALRGRDWRLATARAAGALDGLRGRMGPNGWAPESNDAKVGEAADPDRLGVLFVSGVSVGGASRSTVELAEQLHQHGHRVTVVLGDRPSDSSLAGLVRRLVVKVTPLPGGGLVRRAHRALTRKVTAVPNRSGLPVVTAAFPEHAYRQLVDQHRPDVVVANSLSRAALRLIHDELRALDVPLVLYLREAQALNHLERWGIRPALVIANAEHLAEHARASGVACTVIPSAVDVARATTPTTRTTLLMVNPIPENRPDLAIQVALERPDIPVVLQESWPLPDVDRRALEARVASVANVELRPRTATPAEVYRDARVLLATYPTGRPRVVVEAQHNEIPAVALDQPALAEAVGDAGVLVAPDAPVEDWLAAIAALWDDEVAYERLQHACRRRSSAPETAPLEVARRFEAAIREVAAR